MNSQTGRDGTGRDTGAAAGAGNVGPATPSSQEHTGPRAHTASHARTHARTHERNEADFPVGLTPLNLRYIYIHTYIGGWVCETNREIGFVSFRVRVVRACVRACGAARARMGRDPSSLGLGTRFFPPAAPPSRRGSCPKALALLKRATMCCYRGMRQ